MKPTFITIGLLISINAANASISLIGPSNGGDWLSLGANYDFLDDQQTGDPSSDIVGTANDPGFFTAFDDAGTSSLTDGSLGFRVRLDARGGNQSNPRFDRNLWVGIDADLNGSVDAFLGVSTPSQTTILGIYDAGTGANTSPNTTTIATLTQPYTFTTSASNYNYRPVNHVSDGGTTSDLTPGGTDTDYYVSFSISLSSLATFITAELPSVFNVNNPFNQNTPLRYVLGTSTQSNSLNQDLGGINNKTANLASTWTQLGGFSPTISAAGQVIPETSSSLLVLLGTLIPLTNRRRNPK